MGHVQKRPGGIVRGYVESFGLSSVDAKGVDKWGLKIKGNRLTWLYLQNVH